MRALQCVTRDKLTLRFGFPRSAALCVKEESVQEVDDEFYEHADAHVHLSNDQINEKATLGGVSGSNMYVTARFNAWVSACGWNNGQEMAASNQETMGYFVTEY